MPPDSRRPARPLIEAIDDVQSILKDNNVADLSASRHMRLALERLFEIICEASRHVPADIKERETGIDWPRMTDLGNLLRHAYHRVDVSRLMKTAQDELPPLKVFVERVLAEESKQ